MDNRLKLKELITFFKDLRKDLKNNNVAKKYKYNCFIKIIVDIFKILWNATTAPFIYPIWYIFRKQITSKVYRNTSWQEIVQLIELNKTQEVKYKLMKNGRLLYWLWTYGDDEDPLGRGGLPDIYSNTFWNRFKWSAIRNPRFNVNETKFRTGVITKIITVIDTRNFNYMHISFGIGDSPDGIYFKWMQDESGKWYFIYENNNVNCLFYVGYTGLLKYDLGNTGRFELGYRKTESSYKINH